MTLYELMTDYTKFLSAVENGDIPEEAIADTLEAIEGDIDEKIDNTACLMKLLEAEAKAIKEEEDRLAERRKVKENTRERIKTYLSEMLLAMGKTEFESPRNKITFRKTPGKVVLADEKAFIEWAVKNDDSLVTCGKPTVNKTAIKLALDAGKKIEGAEIVVSQSMQLK
jgi:sugar-specific transcriptional regulator TrmB